MPPPTYHHGNLRAALIEAGLTLLRDRTAEGLSLREIARTVGVSATAVYRHFPDKGSLMSALAHEGLEQLADAQRRASSQAGGGVAGFNATGGAYVRFALANPALFRLIFANPARTHARPEPKEEPPGALALLRANAAALAPPGTNAEVFALQSWAIAHGLAMLMLDGQVPVEQPTIDAVIDVSGVSAGKR